MFIRFVVDEIDESSGVAAGIFQAMYQLWREGKLRPHEERWWADIRVWFNLRLGEPDRLSRSRRPGANQCAVCWFKAGAQHTFVALGKSRHC